MNNDLEFGWSGGKDDPVEHPSHYTRTDGVECIVAIKSMLTPEEFLGYLRGTALKYLWRYRLKNRSQDLKKCGVYLRWLQEAYTGYAEGDEKNEKPIRPGNPGDTDCTCGGRCTSC
jgi:hypothetical protein